jgi:hypothetical protein
MEYWIQDDNCFMFYAILQHSITPGFLDHFNTLSIILNLTLVVGHWTYITMGVRPCPQILPCRRPLSEQVCLAGSNRQTACCDSRIGMFLHQRHTPFQGRSP